MSEHRETDLEKVKELIELMIENDLVELEIADGKNKIALKRPSAGTPVITQVPMAAAPAAAPAPTATPTPAEEAKDDGFVEIVSPMVGTFYSASSPDSDPFVEVGSKVSADTVVCIVEAMKVMDEIKAETSGTIAEVLCKTGEALEFGQPIFKVKPN
jgi:acetyl-CoA carboxylase biotin carboxyl carrier protein